LKHRNDWLSQHQRLALESLKTEGDATDELSQSEEESEPEGDEDEPEESQDSDDETDDTSEESESSDEETALYLDLDGEDVSLDTVREWKKGHMLQKDFTQKRMEDARVEKQNIAERERLVGESDRIEAMVKSLGTLTQSLKDEGFYSDEDISAFNGKVTELTQSIAGNRQTSRDNLAKDEHAMLFKRNKAWLNEEGDNLSEKGTAEIKLINDYFASENFTQAEVKDIISHKLMIAIHKAAQFDNLKKKTVKLKAKVKKVPVVVRPKSKPKAPSTVTKTAEESVFDL